MSELLRRQCSFLLAIGVEDSVLLTWAAQYFWAIELAQFLRLLLLKLLQNWWN